jgi:hypothetical protein
MSRAEIRNFSPPVRFNPVERLERASGLIEGSEAKDLRQEAIMRYMKYIAVLAVILAMPLAYSQAQVRVGVGVGPVGVGVGVGPGYVGAAPVCSYGYYGYYPYACAPYGFYGPDWFAGGVFIGAGPWFHGPAWLGHWGTAYGWRGVPGFGYGRGFYGHYYGRGPVFAGHGYVGRGYVGHGFAGHGPVARGPVGHGPVAHGGGFHGAPASHGGGFHGGSGFHGGRR